MIATETVPDGSRYARCIQSSKRVRWDIDEDVIRGRRFDAAHKFLPDGLSLADAFTTLSPDHGCLLWVAAPWPPITQVPKFARRDHNSRNNSAPNRTNNSRIAADRDRPRHS